MSDKKVTLNQEEAAQLTEFIELTDSMLTKQAEEIETLKAEKEQLQNQEKQAADEDQPVLTEEKVAATVENLIEAGLAKEGEREDLVKHLKDPENVLQALDKVATLRAKSAGTPPRMGKVAGTGTDAAGGRERESDAHFERSFG